MGINYQQVERLAGRLLALNWKPTGFATFEAARPTRQPAQQADFFFFNCALLFDFYGLKTEIDGNYVKGADLFFAFARLRAEKDPEFFSASKLRFRRLQRDEVF